MRPPKGGFFILRMDLLRRKSFFADWSLAPVWSVLIAVVLAGVWLQPNHYWPWTAFHADAWMAVVGLAGGGAIVVCLWRTPVPWHASELVVVACLWIIACQFLSGQIQSAGHVTINAAYLMGLLLTMQVGAAGAISGNGRKTLDVLLLAILLAAVLSVMIQLHQWLQLDLPQYWVMEGGGARPYANLGQPNQLGTLLVWGLAAVAWFCLHGRLRPPLAIVAALVLIVGLALTRSRTAAVEVGVLMLGIWAWRSLWPSRSWIRAAACLVLAYVALLVALPAAKSFLFPDAALYGAQGSMLDAASSNARLSIYRLYFGALSEQPWWGYGWNQLTRAQLAVAEAYPAHGSLAMHAHNLFLDVALWVGVPLAIVLAVAMLFWTARSLLAVQSGADALLMLMLLALGVHAMLELPLHYGYFIWPAGMIVGVINVQLRHRPVGHARAFVLPAIWLTCVLTTLIVIRDYVVAEEEYRITRFEALRIGRTPPGPRPEMWALTQMDDLIWLARITPSSGMPPSELERLRSTASMYPALPSILKLAEALALNGMADESAMWLRRLQKITSPQHQELGKAYWDARSASEPAVARVAWPR